MRSEMQEILSISTELSIFCTPQPAVRCWLGIKIHDRWHFLLLTFLHLISKVDCNFFFLFTVQYELFFFLPLLLPLFLVLLFSSSSFFLLSGFFFFFQVVQPSLSQICFGWRRMSSASPHPSLVSHFLLKQYFPHLSNRPDQTFGFFFI